MRELDLLLDRFLCDGLERMDDADLGRLEQLLKAPDQDIFAWLTGASVPPDADDARVVDIIRSTMSAHADGRLDRK